MKTRLQIPRVLQPYAGGKMEIALGGKTVAEVLEELKNEHPRLYECICDETDRIRQHINLFLNESLLVFPGADKTKLAAGDVVSVFQSVSGG